MAKINDLRILTSEDPICYDSKSIVYFIFDNGNEPIILSTRYVAEKKDLVDWFDRATKDDGIRIVAVWPGQYRSEAFLCDPAIALDYFKR